MYIIHPKPIPVSTTITTIVEKENKNNNIIIICILISFYLLYIVFQSGVNYNSLPISTTIYLGTTTCMVVYYVIINIINY